MLKPKLKRILSVLTSMRFAIALLLLIAIASVIGTVLKQGEAYNNYINRFGDLWAQIFTTLDLHQIYSSWWFLLILFFLVSSTCLCILRTWPKFYKQLKTYQTHIRKDFIAKQKFHFFALTSLNLAQIYTLLNNKGFTYKTKQYSKNSTLIVAKAGKANKWGYLFAHIGIIIICVGGLIDGNLPLKFKQWQGNIKPFKNNNNSNFMPSNAILDETNSSFRANLFIPEQEIANLAIINSTDGILGQKLPFKVELKRFWVDYYTTGMPKRFVSDIIIHDGDNKPISTSLEVNKPFSYKGFNFYQASFEDGGSKLNLKINNLALENSKNNNIDKSINIKVGEVKKIKLNQQEYNLEITEFRAINVHDLSSKDKKQNKAPNKLAENFINLHGTSANLQNKKFTNVGPSIQYTLRDNTGQALAYHTYMLPIMINNYPTFLVGVKNNLASNFAYLHIPADIDNSINTWVNLYQALQQDKLRSLAALNYANKQNITMKDSLFTSSYKALNIFAEGGLSGLADFIQKSVPLKEQANASEIILRILQSTLWELWQLSLTPQTKLEQNSTNEEYLQRALVALSDVKLLKSNVWFNLINFTEKKASVIQVTKAPGQNIVYIGCLALVIGVFLMLFIQEKRLWIILENIQDDEQNKKVTYKMSLALQVQRHNQQAQHFFNEIHHEFNNV